MSLDVKACTKCGLDKPLSEFSKAPRGKYGRKASCKACDAANHQARGISRAMPLDEIRQRLSDRRGDAKKCSKCGEVKPREEFHKAADGRHGPILKSACKPCHASRVREWYSRNSDRSNTNRRRLQLRKDYDLTPEEYEAMVAEQNGVCAICKRPERTKRDGKVMRMPVDHCHETGLIRALLCQRCNRAIGLFDDDTEILGKAIEYLLLHRARAAK